VVCLAQPQLVPLPDDPIERSRSAVVYIHSVLTGNRDITGTGFFISGAGYALTCRHVVAGASRIWVRLPDGTTKIATTVASLAATDLALLKVDVVNTPYLQYGSTGRLKPGDPVAVIGYPVNKVTGGQDAIVSKGTLKAFESNRQLFEIDAEVSPGASGGPVLDRAGKVIAVAWADVVGHPDQNYAVSINEAWPLLDKTSETMPMATYLRLLTPDVTKGTVLDMSGKDWLSWKDEDRGRHLAGLMAAFNVARLYVQTYDEALTDKPGERVAGGKWVLNSLKDVWRLPFSMEEYQKEIDGYYRDADNLDSLVILALFTVNQRMTERQSRAASLPGQVADGSPAGSAAPSPPPARAPSDGVQ
jgi:hypothetical protein